MEFVPVTDPDRLRELGLANLLWYRWHHGAYTPSVKEPWEDYSPVTIVGAASRGKYHLLLED